MQFSPTKNHQKAEHFTYLEDPGIKTHQKQRIKTQYFMMEIQTFFCFFFHGE